MLWKGSEDIELGTPEILLKPKSGRGWRYTIFINKRDFISNKPEKVIFDSRKGAKEIRLLLKNLVLHRTKSHFGGREQNK